MTWLPKIVCLDFETCDDRGASLDYYREDFRVWSLAASWRNQAGEIESFFTADDKTIRAFMKRLHDTQVPVVVQNLMFEWGCTMAKFPDLNINWASDTMFLAASFDSGAHSWEKPDRPGWTPGLSLEAIASRVLPEQDHGHKATAYQWLQDNHNIKNRFGANLHLLPEDILKQYNIADTETTLKIYEILDAELAEIAVNTDWVGWRQPFEFYKGRCFGLAQNKVRGLPVDLTAAQNYVEQIDAELADIERQFRSWGGDHISRLEAQWALDYVNGVKTERGRASRKTKLEADPSIAKFNINSANHLKALFVDTLNMEIQATTPTGKPSFAAADLKHWGEGGRILSLKGKRKIVQAQAANIFVNSQYDGKLHIDTKPLGAVTYRVSGGS